MHISSTARIRAILLVTLLALGMGAPRSSQAQEFDILIRGGWVLDGTGSPAFRADLGIVGDEIVRVGLLDGATATRVIDADGMHVVPGFIDMHSHADRALAGVSMQTRNAPNLVVQGITSIVVGPDGRNARWPITDEIEAYRSLGIPMNVVPMVGHNTVRGEVMGADYEREATAEEIEEMAALVRQGMESGAWGLGAGPEYRPGRFSTTEEIIALAHVVADYDGFYYSHQRSQSPLPKWQVPSMVDEKPLTGAEGMEETIRIGRETGIRVVGTHIKAKGTDTWGHSMNDVLRIDRARAEGVQVYLDQYPYETFGGSATGIIPQWGFAPPGTDRSGGLDDPAWNRGGLLDNSKENLAANWDDPVFREELRIDLEYLIEYNGGADRQIVVNAPDHPETVGMTLEEVAEANGRTPVEQLIAYAMEGEQLLPHGVLFRPLAAHRFDVDTYMRQEYTATSTDGGVSLGSRPGQHPRYFGSYPRKIAHYARDREVISLPFAIRSSTGLPAQIIGVQDRGFLREGYKADIVVFDYATIQDRATITEPDLEPEGIHFVLVNGVFTLDEGERTGALPGEVLDKNELRNEARRTTMEASRGVR